MSKEVFVPAGEKPQETATLLLAAAQEQGLDASVVRTSTLSANGSGFSVPAEVVARLNYKGDDAEEKPKPKKTAKKSASKG